MDGLSLGQEIARSRKKAGLTQKELAEAVGISSAVLSRYERDARDPPTPILKNIAVKLKITCDKLMGLERHNPAVYQTKSEYALLDGLRSLNSLGQERLLGYMSDLLEAPKYVEKG